MPATDRASANRCPNAMIARLHLIPTLRWSSPDHLPVTTARVSGLSIIKHSRSSTCFPASRLRHTRYSGRPSITRSAPTLITTVLTPFNAPLTLTLFAAAGSVRHDTDHHVQRFPTVNHDIAGPLPPHKPADTPRSWRISTSSDGRRPPQSPSRLAASPERSLLLLNARGCSPAARSRVHDRPEHA